MPAPEVVPPRRRPPGQSPARGRRLASAALVVLVLAVALLLGGCTRVRTALAVQGDDTLAGEIVIATAGGPPPLVELAPALAGRVAVAEYRVEDYQGSRLRFGGLRLDELNTLATVAPAAEGRFRFTLRRVGNRLLLDGQVDLTAVPVDRADVQLKVAFPGEVVSADGELDDNTVSWTFTAGQVNEFNAVVGAPDPTAPSLARWALLVGAVVAAAAMGAVLLAKSHRNPPVRTAGGSGL